ncbi:transposable element Tc3 transposase [Trichonephila clavata]|uniref:Transposable element Tc3 transposase n=1 Tax=Trichonephila clavata TaxID=2740835 RepID=A0A8X6FFP8_TRICU|nr:transposable element Tc3 transposase [Trichonephila clavata]
MASANRITLNGFVNCQNNQCWSTTNAHIIWERPIHYETLSVWRAVSRRRIIGPIFISSTVDSTVYINIITEFISSLNSDERYAWLQQKGATCPTSWESMEVLTESFDDHFQKILDTTFTGFVNYEFFFLSGYLKNVVFRNNPQTLDKLKSNILHQISDINFHTHHKVSINLVKRVLLCVQENEHHFEHLL